MWRTPTLQERTASQFLGVCEGKSANNLPMVFIPGLSKALSVWFAASLIALNWARRHLSVLLVQMKFLRHRCLSISLWENMVVFWSGPQGSS